MSEAVLGDARSIERQLDAAASPLDTHTDLSFRETLAIVWRATGYIRFFKARFATKFVLMWISMLTPLILPWPIKMVIDNVVLGLAVDPTAFPPYFAPFASLLDGLSPTAMMVALVGLMASMVALFGQFTPSAVDYVEAGLAEGHDTATQTENEANAAYSKYAGVLGLIEFRLQLRLTQALNHLMRSQLFERVMALPSRLTNDQRIGDSLYRVMYDTTDIANVFYQFIISPTLAVMTAILIVVVMRTNYGDAPEIIYLALAILPLQFFALLPFPRLMRRKSQASHAAGAVTTGNIEEGMSNVLAVQSLGSNARERRRFENASAMSFRRYRGQVLVNLLYRVAMGAATGVLGLVAFFIVTRNVIAGTMTPGDYGVVLYYYMWLSGALTAIPYLWIRMQHSIPGIRRVFFLMDLPSEGDSSGVELEGVSDGLAMEGVGLVYPDGRRALEGVDLTVRVGEVVALVGPTGAGKTSLASLVPRFFDASEGRIRIDGVDIRDIALPSLRRQVAYVFQETQLFSDSILDNIRYANRQATLADVERAARTAGAHDFIAALPEGYDTALGTVVSKLSVGQKQRISIARGLVQDPGILILDEPTSALDPETESYLVRSLHEAAKDRLVIVVAHRLSTIAHADRIVFLDDGRVVEQGTPAELMARPGGRYREFAALQTTGAA